MKAIIHEMGNGLPDADNYVPGNDGELYYVVSLIGSIQTGGPGGGNWIRADVDPADWTDCTKEDEFPAQVILVE